MEELNEHQADATENSTAGPRTPEEISGGPVENDGSDGAHTPQSQADYDEEDNGENPASPAMGYQSSSGASSPVDESYENQEDSQLNQEMHTPGSPDDPDVHEKDDGDEEAVDNPQSPSSPAPSDSNNAADKSIGSIESDSDNDLASPKKTRRNVVQSDDEDDNVSNANSSASPKQASPDEQSSKPTRTVVIDEDDQDSQENGESAESPTKSPPRKSKIIDSDDDNEEGNGEENISKKTKEIFGSDSEEDSEKEEVDKEKTNMMANIFGEDSSDDDEKQTDKDKETNEEKPVDSDEGDAKLLRVEGDSDDGGKEWDFDIMLRKKRSEKKRRRHNRDSILLISDSDEKVQSLVHAMSEAANEDRASNQDKLPAIQKRKLLPMVRSMLLKADLFETLLENGMMSGIAEWLAPLPDKSLPALEVRSTLLKILESYPRLEQGILKQSGLGKAVMLLFKHPKETKENKMIAAKLIREWSRPIFQLDTDFRSVSREDRLQQDYARMPETKRRRISLDADGVPNPSSRIRERSDSADEGDQSGLRPGQAGFINRARVPKPSTKDYVIRPKPAIEGRFQGPSKSRTSDRFERAQRDFRERNRAQKAKRAIGVNIAGNKMDI